MRDDSFLRKAARWLSVQPASPELAVSQIVAAGRQMPFLYALVLINGAAVAFTHYGIAPNLLTLGVALTLFGICGARLAAWIGLRDYPWTPAEAVRELRRAVVFSALMSSALLAWAISLGGYGSAYEQGHVAFFIAITVIGCIFCLMHIPQAATVIAVMVTIPYAFTYLSAGHPVFTAIAVNTMLVTVVMMQVLATHFRAFVRLEESKAALLAKQAETEALGCENARLAHTDSLTGLPNRRHFFARLDALIAESAGAGRRFALGVIDLDGFKPVNDTHGHATGDRVLVEASRRLRTLDDGGLMFARLGGDEFAFLAEGDIDEAAAVALGRSVCERLGGLFLAGERKLAISGSCGLALYPGAGDTSDVLFERADYALYHVKSHARGSARLFSAEDEDVVRQDRLIEKALLEADLEAEMDLHFQPIVDIVDGCDVEAEALARWTSPLVGSVAPDRFIAIAERTGHMQVLTPVLLRKALRTAASWPAGIGLSFNLSACDITSPATMIAVVAAIRQGSVDPGRITFEITESAVIHDFDVACAHIRTLRALGARIALDDFGIGYSSLAYVHRLPLDEIKIDRSFTADIQTRPEGRNVVKIILDLCRTLHLDCVVEGVENEGQLALLQDLGCQRIQGYHFSRPLTAAAFQARLQTAGAPCLTMTALA